MPLSAGTKLGQYTVLSQIGAGGMGEVYQAHDTKLGRDVALKVLPQAFARDDERMARFQREAKVLASLNHPKIASIYGLEDSGSTHALVMELVEGPTLADRITQGSIPIGEALLLAKQICEALEYAHERGIVHRDLKPANVKVTSEDAVKILDFGLAKAIEGDAASIDAANSPTITHMATQAGVLLGTASYMSPEQAKAKPVDRRADIWAFGCVLYEMLTGKMVFHGETVTDTLAAVIMRDPDWSLLPAAIPQHVRVLLRRCLQKDPKQRLRDIGDARIAIEEYLADPAGTSVVPLPAATTTQRRSGLFAWSASVVLLIAVLVLGFLYFRQPPVEAPLTRLEINTPATSDPLSFAISPDGRFLAFVASGDGQQRLWLRPLDMLTAQPITGSEGAAHPFWSPDSRSIGFLAELKLKKIDIGGGAPETLAGAPLGLGGTWNREGVIVYAPSVVTPLFRVPSSGGDPAAITQLALPNEMAHALPQFLPDGRHLLFFVGGLNSGVYLASLDSTESRHLLAADTQAIYSPPGYLLFMRKGTLFSAPFDAKRMELRGDPVSVADSVAFAPAPNNIGIGGFSVSETGLLAYRVSGGANRHRETWFDRSGKEVGSVGALDENNLADSALAPDGRHIAVVRTVERNTDVWVLDTARGVPSRFTFDPANDISPIWSPDGSRIAFASARKGSYNLFQKSSRGAGNEERLREAPETELPVDWSPDGRYILFVHVTTKTNGGLWVLPLFGDRKPFVFADTNFDETLGQFSPDGRWIAYQSNESGRYEIYVQSFPGPGGKWQVSSGGGMAARWRHDGKELFYISPDAKLMAASIQTAGQTAVPGAPVTLFQTRIVGGGVFATQSAQYAVAPDGQRFLINSSAGDATPSPITIVTNWTRGLK